MMMTMLMMTMTMMLPLKSWMITQRPEYDDDQRALHCSLKLATNWGRSFLHFAKVERQRSWWSWSWYCLHTSKWRWQCDDYEDNDDYQLAKLKYQVCCWSCKQRECAKQFWEEVNSWWEPSTNTKSGKNCTLVWIFCRIQFSQKFKLGK